MGTVIPLSVLSKETVQLYIRNGVPIKNIFRTDLRDDEDIKKGEWKGGKIDGCNDDKGDDDVEIELTKDKDIKINYLNPEGAKCPKKK